MKVLIMVFCLFHLVCYVLCFPHYNPGDLAPTFSIQTLDGRLVFKKRALNDTTPSNPIIFSAFTHHSAFLRALWTEEGSVRHLLESSPKNTQYIFISLDDNAKNDVKFMRKKIFKEMAKLYQEKKEKIALGNKMNDIDQGMLQSKVLFKREIRNFHDLNASGKLISQHGKKDLTKYNLVSKKNKLLRVSRHLELFDSTHSGESELVNWKKHFHFASFPLFTFGNWIPFVMARWPCLGTGCGLSQVAFKNSKGDILQVASRLDARYDWQPTPFRSLAKHEKMRVKYIENACQSFANKSKNETKVALVSAGSQCTIFEKIKNVAKTGIKFVLIYANKDEPLNEIKCQKQECYHLLHASASMISYEAGEKAREILKKQELYFDFQTTSQDNFFFAIDHKGRLNEIGLFLYPSLRFLAYEAQWFHYEADLLKNATGRAKVINVFNHTVMQGVKGAVKEIHLPKDFLKYRNVELEMALRCPDAYDSSCPHWDHVIHLTVCCEKNHELCGEELGRWITPYSRSMGKWLTPITSLLPLFTSSTCTLTMKTVPWEMPWNPTLNIRLSGHVLGLQFLLQNGYIVISDMKRGAYTATLVNRDMVWKLGKLQSAYNELGFYVEPYLTPCTSFVLDSKDGYSDKRFSPNLVPYKVVKLFRGGIFDKDYNKKYKAVKFKPPHWTKKVELVAIITGHGKDNNGCAEFCVTSHHFVINTVSENVRVFKNAATTLGCADRVEQGVEPNEHGTWLYGRDGWCPGQEVVPWHVDVTSQVHLKKTNNIKYFSYFEGHDPNPKHSPGSIDMSSYLVFYRPAADL